MTRAEIILGLIRQQPRNFDELVAATGFTDAIVRTTLSDLRRSGYMEPIPTTYVATEKAASGEKPKIDWISQRLQRNSVSDGRHSARSSLTMVAQSIKSNPNSVFAMGSMA